MLVLTRKKDEIIQIHTPDKHVISLKITDIGNGQVKIGIEAPAWYAILRKELINKNA